MAPHHKKDEIMRNLQELLALNPSGIPVDSLANRYNTHFKKSLNLRGNGINGVKSLADTFSCFEKVVGKNGKGILQLKKGGQDEVKKTKKVSENASAKTAASFGNTIQQDRLTLVKEHSKVGKKGSKTSDVQEPSKLPSNQQIPSLFQLTPNPSTQMLSFSGQQRTTMQHSVSSTEFDALQNEQVPPLLPQETYQWRGAQSGTALMYPQPSPLLPLGPQQIPTSFPSSPQQDRLTLVKEHSKVGKKGSKTSDVQEPSKLPSNQQIPSLFQLTPNPSAQMLSFSGQQRTTVQHSVANTKFDALQNEQVPPLLPQESYQWRGAQSGTALMYPQPSPLLPLGPQQMPTPFPSSPHRKKTNQSLQSSQLIDNVRTTLTISPTDWKTAEYKAQSRDTLSITNNSNIFGRDTLVWEPSNAAAAAAVGHSDWPTLSQGASTKKKKTEIKKDQKAEAENRRIKFDHLAISEIQSRKGGRRRPPKDEINSRALFHIQALAEQNEHVSIELVMKGVMEHFGQTNIRQLGLYKETDLEAIHEHQRLLSRINAYVSAFCKCRSIATLFELLKDLGNIQDGKDCFEELNVGPLCKFPAVYTLFKFPPNQSDDDIIKVTTMDILGLLRDYMRKKDLWRTKVDLTDFMKYILEHYGVSDPYQLGIRVQSVALGVSVIKKAQREEKNTVDGCRTAIMAKLKQEAEASLESVKKSILEPANTNKERSRLDNRRRYADMTAAEAILKVFENAQPLLEHEPRLRSFFRALPAIVNNDLARNLFQLAICLGDKEFPQEYLPGNEEQAEEENEQSEVEASVCANKIPDQEEIVGDVEKFLNRLQDVPTLLDLSRIESRLCQNRNVSSFLDLKKGTFLHFLTSSPKLLLQFGGSILGATNQKANQGTPYHPSPHDLIDFIRQCGKQNMNDVKVVERALCEHFQTTSVDEFGRGSLQRLISKAKNVQHDEEQNRITYEQALCTQTRIKGISTSHVGLRGHQSRCIALLSLNSTPLLEDLAEWSQWALIFKPEHGALKGFIEKWSGAEVPYDPEDSQLDEPIKILALETRPGVLLKLASKTSADDFRDSAIKEDSRLTAGHLVSILTRDGIHNAPLILLQNYFESALKAIFSKDVPLVPGGPPEKTDADIKVVTFVLDCLILIPTKICHAVAEVFLKPLSEVIGDKRSKKLLKDSCVTTKQLNKLQQLGFLLGIVEWSETFDLKLKNPSSNEKNQKEACLIDIASLLPETDKPESDGSSMTKEEEDNLNFDLDEDFHTELGDVETQSDASAENDESTPAKKSTEDSKGDESEIKDEVQSEVINHEDRHIENEGLENGSDKTDDDQQEMQISEIPEDEIPESTRLTPSQEEMLHCKAVIDNIRNKEFGIGAILSKEGESLMNVQKARIARSLERLSCELYSKDTHFVLELVQNADDNTYADGCQQPSLLFQLEDSNITVYNNEKGFSTENIHALCDVGKSTKGKHKYGYIGHKGIGFKSVFRVTDRPEIHSNGFHICFDRQADSLGFILPTWTGASKVADVTEEGDKDSKGWQTRIVLPLKDEVCKTNKLLNRFDDIQPSLLLFLHRLRSIQVVNQPKSTVVEMKRIDHPKNVIEIKHSDGTDFWLVVKEMISVNKSVCDRVDMESTELALAFPLPKAKSALETVMKDQYIFAYLPLRSYGFKFIIQGDFDIPSSREDVDSDSAWNQWIKQHLPALFISALQFFKDYYGSNDEEVAVCRFLQFVPVGGQILGFFESVANDIHQKLKSYPCLPVQVPGENGSTVWKQPSEAIIVHDRLVQELVSPEALHSHLGCYYLSNVVSSLLNAALLRSLGVKIITTSNLISLFKGEVLKAKTDGVSLTITSIAKWLTCIYRCREEEHDISEEPIKEIQALPIIPLSNGMWKDLQEKSVFFSLTFENQRTDVYAPKKASKKEMQGSIQILESDMYILHGDLLTCQDSLANSQVMLMMEQLGVCHIKPYDVIHNHIFPALRSEDWKNKRADVLVSYIVYIKDQTQQQPDICKMEDLKPIAQVRTDRGTFVNPSREPIHFTKMYGNKYDLKNELTGGDWTFVDECYLRCSKQGSTTHIPQWKQFFSDLGVLSLIAIERKTITLQKSAMDASVWSLEYDTWPASSDGCFQIEDSRSRELEKLFENNTKGTNDNHRVMKNLLNILEKEWDYFGEFVTASLVIDNHRKRSIESSFAKLLLRSSWISTSPILDPNCEVGGRTDKRLLPPNQVFLFSTYLHRFLNNHVPYLDGPTPENKEVINFLEIKGDDVVKDVKFIFDMLQGWCTRGMKCPPDEIMKSGATFTTSVKHILQVYIYLQMNSSPGQLSHFFDSFPAVFLPSKLHDENTIVTGKFVHKSMTYWVDPTKLFHKYSASSDKVSVTENYGPNSDFFLKHLKIDETPNMLEYLQLLVKITSENQLPNINVHTDVLKIFGILGEKCAISGHTYGRSNSTKDVTDIDTYRASYLKDILKGYKVFPTKANRWVSLDDEPLMVDEGSKELEVLFCSNQDIHFLLEDAGENPKVRRGVGSSANWEQTREHENIQRFLKACGVKRLSECVEHDPIEELTQPCPSLKNLMHRVVPLVQSFLFYKYGDVHQRLVSKVKIISKLKIMNFMTASRLEVTYRLNYSKDGENKIAIESIKRTCSITRNFYINKAIEQNIQKDTSVRKEIAKFFSDGDQACQKELQTFLMTLLVMQRSNVALDEEFLKEMGLSKVEGVELWEVEKAEEPKPIPVPKPVEVVPSVENQNATKRGLEKAEDGSGIYSWPPKSSAYGVVHTDKAKNPSEEASLKQWPPPLPSQRLSDVPPSQDKAKNPSEEASMKQWPPPAQRLFDVPPRADIIEEELDARDDVKAPDNRPTSNSNKDRQVDHDHYTTTNYGSDVDNSRTVTSRYGSGSIPEMGKIKPTEVNRNLTGGISANPTSLGPGPGGDRQFQTPPNPHRIASSHSISPMTFSPSPHVDVQLVEEDITPDLRDLPFFEDSQINVSNPSDDIVGRWGEELVYQLLRNQYECKSDVKSTVRWANEQAETGTPYDIEIQTKYDDGDRVCTEYVEVKATNSSEKKHFQISANEVTFAQQHAPHYHLYRVYNAGKKDTVKVCSLKNLSEKMVKKQVILFMRI